jgi:hypothetical protein
LTPEAARVAAASPTPDRAISSATPMNVGEIGCSQVREGGLSERGGDGLAELRAGVGHESGNGAVGGVNVEV